MVSSRTRFAPALLLAGAALGPGMAAAEEPAPPTRAHGPVHPDKAGTDDAIIVVAGHPPTDFAILSATTTLGGDALLAQARGQIGDVLANLPGVSATSFAPGASRPVLRGFSGGRVAVLIDGIGSIDASTVSVDHAVVFDPLSVDHIDVFHGPSVLLFGGNAIGGAVNALDKRIPRSVPEGVAATLTGGYATAADERSLGGSVDLAIAPRLAAHFDASWRKSDDVRTGGLIYSPSLRAELIAQGEEELAATSGRIANSAARTLTVGAGLAFIDQGGDLGLSVQRFDTRYGVPARPGGEAGVAIDLKQTRIDLRGSVKIGGILDSLQFRGAYGDYRHAELEDGIAGTRFAGEGIEFRADLVQAERAGWRGRSGVHLAQRSLAIEGEEAFTPDYETANLGFFTLQSLKIGGGLAIEGAGRFERARVSATQVAFSRQFELWSGAAGLSWDSGDGLTLGANYVRGARAPSAEELLSDGIHIATQSYELGDPGFGKETSDGFEASAKWAGTRGSVSLTGFVTRFRGYIASIPNGEEIEGFPVYRYRQVPARFAGFEASGEYRALTWDDGDLTVSAAGDFTHARLPGIGAAPLIPPLRLRGGLAVRQGALRLNGEVEWNARQSRVGPGEAPVPGFTLVNLGADWHPLGEEGPLTITFSADNLLDVVGRRAASVTRDFVPLPGRGLRLTARFDF